MFNQWINGQPWWLTLLLLPAIVIAGVLARAFRYAAIVVVIVVVVLIGSAIWAATRRR